MSETKKRPRAKKRTYVHRPNAMCFTVYSQDGSPVPRHVLDEVNDSIIEIARHYNLLVGIADS